MKKPIGYKNIRPGDQSKPQPVFQLTTEQKALQATIGKLTAVIRLGKDAEAKREALRESCQHEVFRDERGHPYDYRYCVLCGTPMGHV